jgi:hypothetical protein
VIILFMDPVIAAVVSAIAAGAATGLNETVAQAIRDAYATLKRLITQRGVDVSGVENKPASEAKRNSLVEDLEDAGAGADPEVRAATEVLLAALREHAPRAGAAVGLDLTRVEAAALRIGTVEATGTGVKIEDGRFTGDVTIDQVRAGVWGSGRP